VNQNPEQEQLNRLKKIYEARFNRVLSDAEVLEIKTSLFYLGRAIARYERRHRERNGN